MISTTPYSVERVERVIARRELRDNIIEAVVFANAHGPRGIGCPFESFLVGVVGALLDLTRLSRSESIALVDAGMERV